MKKSSVQRVITMAAVASTLTLTYAANAADIGFVVGSDGLVDKPFDIGWTNRLTLQGHTVIPLAQNLLSSDPSLATIDLFIVSQDVGSGTYLSGIGINQPQPILTYEYGVYDEIFGATGNGASTGLLTNGITILDPLHPLAAGLSGNVSIYTGEGGNGTIGRFSTVSSGTQVIAVSADVPAQGIFAVLPAGAVGAGTNTWSAVRMTLPAYDAWDPNFVTANGWQLLDNAVTYALVPEPTSIALIGLGMAFFLARRRRR